MELKEYVSLYMHINERYYNKEVLLGTIVRGLNERILQWTWLPYAYKICYPSRCINRECTKPLIKLRQLGDLFSNQNMTEIPQDVHNCSLKKLPSKDVHNSSLKNIQCRAHTIIAWLNCPAKSTHPNHFFGTYWASVSNFHVQMDVIIIIMRYVWGVA